MASIKDIEKVVADDEDVVDIVIYRRDDEPYTAADGTASTIGVLGRESKAYRAAQRRADRRILKGRRRSLTPEELEASRIEKATAAVKRWHGWEDGKSELACTPENIAQILGFRHILEQVEEGIENHTGFSANASKS